ncbi:hypothetical protein Tco_0531682 [Tanacetum coccineum]
MFPDNSVNPSASPNALSPFGSKLVSQLLIKNPNDSETCEFLLYVTISTPSGIAGRICFLKVGHVLLSCQILWFVDYVADPRAPLILGRPLLRTAHALIDVHGELMTLRHDDQSVTFKVGDTIDSSQYNIIESVNELMLLDFACEVYVHRKYLKIYKCGIPTSTSDLMIDSALHLLTPIGGDVIFNGMKIAMHFLK